MGETCTALIAEPVPVGIGRPLSSELAFGSRAVLAGVYRAMRKGGTLYRASKPIIGLAGGIGAGKSTVASLFAELGAAVIDSDRLNHEELNAPEVLGTLRQWWGDGVIGPDGKADRTAIRGIVGQDAGALRRLEGLVHPRIAQRTSELIAGWSSDPGIRAIVWDAPLLFEVGLADRCDCVVFVEAPAAARLARVSVGRGWSVEDLERLEKQQKPLDLKRANADYTVENNSDVSALRRQVAEVFSRILSGA